MKVQYSSTRDSTRAVHSFESAVMKGLSADGGLFVPSLPIFSDVAIEQLRGKSYLEVFFAVVRSFVPDDEIKDQDLQCIIEKSVSTFSHPGNILNGAVFDYYLELEVTPIVKTDHGWVLELFHGPTLAFKDVALQFLGNVFEHFLNARSTGQKRMTILVATSGDTGSAAIHGMRGKKNIDTFVMFPHKKVSAMQELQMTTVIDRHVHCIRLQGDFDNAQSIVKAAFSDVNFKESVQLGAVNSINIARIVAQISYYFYSWLRVTDHMLAAGQESVSLNYAVPTGNFGDILAGYYAKRMGLPIDKLLVCTNSNDVLHRFLQTGVYQRQPAVETIAPSMDISVSSNFERYLYHLSGDNEVVLRQWMEQFESTGCLKVSQEQLRQAQSDFLSHSSTDQDIFLAIDLMHRDSHYLVCPHTGTAVSALNHLRLPSDRTVVLATAHPMKFEMAVSRSLSVQEQERLKRPPPLEALLSLPKRSILLPKDVEVIKSFVKYNVEHRDII